MNFRYGAIKMPKLYHGSKTGGIERLRVNKTRSDKIFLTESRLAALIYAVRSFPNLFVFQRGREHFLEVKPQLFERLFKGKTAYIYTVEVKDVEKVKTSAKYSRDNCFSVSRDVLVKSCEVIEDALSELSKYVSSGELVLERYEDLSSKELEAINKDIEESLLYIKNKKEYEEFLKL